MNFPQQYYTFYNYYPYPQQMMQFPPTNYMWPAVDRGNSSLRHKFTKAEDDLLKQLVAKFGESNWMAVASHMKTRTPRQCRERYKNYLSDKIKNGPWTHEEEVLLQEKVKELGQKWAKIALFFESRSDVNVKNHWTALVNRQIRENLSMKNNPAQPIVKAEETKEEDVNSEPIYVPDTVNQDTPPQEDKLYIQPTQDQTPPSAEDAIIEPPKDNNNNSNSSTSIWDQPLVLDPANEWAAVTSSFNGKSLFDFF
ncbi:Myb-like DNA-binding domain containing protein [Trichomonas vaginalis G3]|uniref:Myb-like DNA-binding domain containing protein n=1 Tax=Trichomonas vaginalis (strain ATCC PRA-98 / G3) TaxID=412133 RepID=A2EPE3_TRIV3|nr:RNA polymerase II transcription regulator recruiting protein [Trichomonas vaginalis G3]EAY05451.1 Myb-like DNA-binding domain containing protein [Trichomonas vaginalis G3]KAI5503571.1 RNA polymerase II transcription regulator recruiting protein [Trichomonas vaginalis G3]|eukprot:XP_001317674.1 Myb-like DNA-binding domain containing protein [Trichomonas vaginalis G3]